MISAFIGAYTEAISRIERSEERVRTESDFKRFAAKKNRSHVRKQKRKAKKKR